MTLNLTAARDGAKTMRLIRKSLGARNVMDMKKRVWTTSIAYTAASVDGTGLDAVIQAGDLVLSTGDTGVCFVCTVVPSSDAGTFVKLQA